MKKVLIVTYYWPPAGGVAVQRWLKFANYLVKNNFEVIVFTAENAAYPMVDIALEAQVSPKIKVHKVPLLEPRNLLKRISRKERMSKKNQKDNIDRLFYIPKSELSMKQKMVLWIRANIFIPDARILWINPVVNAISRYIQRGNVLDYLVTTGPPHSVHLIGRRIKKKHQIRWIADFRDPWLEIEYFDFMPLTQFARNRHKRLEKAVVEEADGVTVVAPYWKKIFTRHNQDRVCILTNGYDAPDFVSGRITKEDKFVMVHMGTLQLDRNAPELWNTIQELNEEVPGFEDDFELHVFGNIDERIFDDLRAHKINHQVIKKGFVPHKEAIDKMKSARLLLLLINRNQKNAPGRMTSKIFEYLAAQNPILFLGLKDSDPADVIRNTGSGVVVEFGDKNGLIEELKNAYFQYKEGILKPRSNDIEKYSRENISKQLISFMHTINN